MNKRHVAAAMAIPCLFALAGEAEAQSRRSARAAPPAGFDLRHMPAPSEAEAPRLRPLEEPVAAPSSGLLESWNLSGNAMLGVGRFRVGDIPRRRTNMERVRDNMMDRENRAIAGAGVRISFD